MPPPGPVAVLFHEGDAAGASQTLLRVIPGLRERGWDLRFYVDRPGRLADELRRYGYAPDGRRREVGFSVAWWRYPPGPRAKLPAMAGWFAGLTAWLRRTRPALVHANSLYSLPDALVARSLRLPVYLQLMEMLPEGRKGAAARCLIDTARITPGAPSAAAARRYGGVGGNGSVPLLVRTGVPFPGRPSARPPQPRPLIVGTIGWVCERKGSDVFVDMARRIKAQRDDVEFRIIGANAETPGYGWGTRVLADAADLNITHVPFADGYAELRGWDVFVLPSRFDPYPLTVMEAMASGVPVVGSAIDGIVEQVVPGTGLLARSEDGADFAAKVLELLRDDDKRRRYGRAARGHAERTFTLAEQVTQLEAAWRQAITRTR